MYEQSSHLPYVTFGLLLAMTSSVLGCAQRERYDYDLPTGASLADPASDAAEGGGGDGGGDGDEADLGDGGGDDDLGEGGGAQETAAAILDPEGDDTVLVGPCDTDGEWVQCIVRNEFGCLEGEQTCGAGTWSPCEWTTSGSGT